MAEQNYKDTAAWQKAFELAEAVSDLTKKLAKAEGIPENATAQHAYNRDAEAIARDVASAENQRAFPPEGLHNFSRAQGGVARFETKLLLDVKRGYMRRADAEAVLKLCGELNEVLDSRVKEIEAARLNRQRRPLNPIED